MANLTSAGVVINPNLTVNAASWEVGTKSEKRVAFRYHVRMTLVAQGDGGTTSNIPASAFGLNFLLACGNFVDSANATVIPASVDYTNVSLLAGGGAANAVQQLTGTYETWVEGY